MRFALCERKKYRASFLETLSSYDEFLKVAARVQSYLRHFSFRHAFKFRPLFVFFSTLGNKFSWRFLPHVSKERAGRNKDSADFTKRFLSADYYELKSENVRNDPFNLCIPGADLFFSLSLSFFHLQIIEKSVRFYIITK